MIDAELHALVAEFRALADRVAYLEARLLKPHQRELLSTLLPAIFEAVQDRAFTVADLVEHASVSSNAALLAAVSNRCKLGNLLAAADRILVDGYVATKIGGNQAHRLWMVRKVSP